MQVKGVKGVNCMNMDRTFGGDHVVYVDVELGRTSESVIKRLSFHLAHTDFPHHFLTAA